MTRPIADYLNNFGSCTSTKPVLAASSCAAQLDVEKEASSERQEAAIEAARAEGVAEGRAAAQEDYMAQIEHGKQAFEVRLAAERERWVEQESNKIAANLNEAVSALEANLANCVARVLWPFISETMRHKMVDFLAESVGAFLGGKGQPLIKVRGPQDLLARLRAKGPAQGSMIDYVPSESIDVQMVCGDTLIETQIAAWAARIEALWRD